MLYGVGTTHMDDPFSFQHNRVLVCDIKCPSHIILDNDHITTVFSDRNDDLFLIRILLCGYGTRSWKD